MAAPASARGIGAALRPYDEATKQWSSKKSAQVREDCKRMAWTVDSPAGMFMSASDGTRSYDLRQTCGVIKCEKGELCQKMGRSNQVSPDVRGIELLHNSISPT